MQVPQRCQDAHAEVAEGIEGIDDPLCKIRDQVAYSVSSSCLGTVLLTLSLSPNGLPRNPSWRMSGR